MERNDLKNRFEYHPPKDEETKFAHETIRNTMHRAASDVDLLCPDGREKSLAITKLEEAMMWANAAIARNNAPVPEPGSDV